MKAKKVCGCGRIKGTEAGDLILYQGNSFVIYYDTNQCFLFRWNKQDTEGQGNHARRFLYSLHERKELQDCLSLAATKFIELTKCFLSMAEP